jgi:hypothetical protein
MRTRIPTRAFLAWVDKGVLPFAGGVLEQPYPMWRVVEEMAAGYQAEKASRQRSREQEAQNAMARMRNR